MSHDNYILLNLAGFSQTNHKNRRPLDNPNKITQNSARAPPDLWKVCKNLTKNSIWIWKYILRVMTAILNTYLFLAMYQGLVERMIYPLSTHFKHKWFSVVFHSNNLINDKNRSKTMSSCQILVHNWFCLHLM